jgi:ubiquinone/menaquinone biosynthesis C-methylase UbiE
LGRKDPLWAILTWPGKRGHRWDRGEFFETGERDVERLIGYIDSVGHSFSRRRALDFGCGVGRMTQPLARHFDEAWGVDIAPSMIELARRFNELGERCKYRVNDAPDLRCFSDDTFDFVLSHLTLQHMPPESAKQYMKEFLRVLAPGGLLVFQMAGEPTKVRPASIRRLRRFVRGLIPEALIKLYRKARYRHLIDMHGMKREEVVRVLEENGAEVLDVRPDTSAGGGWTSFRYCATKA